MDMGLARIIHRFHVYRSMSFCVSTLRLSYPKHRAWKPEAQAKDQGGIPSLALQA